MDLNKEAEEYAWKKKNPFSVQLLANELVLATKTDFIEGANSKYVQAKILQAQIDMITSFEKTDDFGQDHRNYFKKIKQNLQQQLENLI